MGQITLRLDIIEKLNEIARQENRSIEETLDDILEKRLLQHQQDRQMQEFRAKLYKMARDYWRKVGDQERLALTDAELDEQFWLFDQDDIPHLKSDQGKVNVPPSPLESLVGIFDFGTSDIASEIDAMRAKHFKDRFGDNP